MSLTFGIGPFAGEPNGAFNFDLSGAPAHRIFFHDYPRRLRAVVGDRVVLDSVGGKLLHETGLPARVYIPRSDVVPGALGDSETRSVCPYKGHSRYLSVAGIDDAAWTYDAPLPDAIKVQEHVCFDDERVEVELGPPRAQLPG